MACACCQATDVVEPTAFVVRHIQPEFSVGVDIGAAFSGYTYTSMNPKDPVTQVWFYFPEEERLSQRCPKTLSAILYRRAAGRWRPVEWGRRAYNQYQEMPPARRRDHCLLEDFKIALADDVERARFMQQLPLNCGLTVELVMADFLVFVSRHALLKLAQHYQREVSAIDVQWTITVPADWPYGSQLVMREAAVAAGMVDKRYNDERLSVIPEPEAAALSAVHNGEMRSNSGDSFMVVDAGGATTDITMHEVGADGHLAEAIHATGLLAGSKLIDREFEDWMCNQVVTANVFHQWKDQYPADYLKLLHGDWQHAKCSFGEPRKREWFIAIEPSLAAAIPPQLKTELTLRGILGGNGDSLILHETEMAEFFQRIVKAISGMVCDVVARVGRAPNKILLVGGLGSSRHLFNELLALASGREGWHADVVQPATGYYAVVEGAALFPKEVVQVVRRIATRSYGLVLMTRPDLPVGGADTSGPRDARRSGVSFMASRAIKKWEPFISIGDDIETRNENKETFFKKITIGGRVTRVDIPIYQAGTNNPVFGTDSQPVCVAKMTVELAVRKGAKLPKNPSELREVNLHYRMGRSKITVVARTWQSVVSTCEVPFLYDPDSVLVEDDGVLIG